MSRKNEARHGSLRMYQMGCRCDFCRSHWNAYIRDYRAKKKLEEEQELALRLMDTESHEI